jgi:hypothetical protein
MPATSLRAFLRREDQFIELKALEWRDFASLNKKRYRNVTNSRSGIEDELARVTIAEVATSYSPNRAFRAF